MKSFGGRWYQKRKANKDDTLEGKDVTDMGIERDALVGSEFHTGATKNSPTATSTYRVLGVDDKFSNKWFMT